ncbi:hypothetical protein B0H19DRAFT_1063268 [Mycena capillaripes]|nr:hypothetical protein B0H19DRAFT_1063268 [Mycena capillaripes]
MAEMLPKMLENRILSPMGQFWGLSAKKNSPANLAAAQPLYKTLRCQNLDPKILQFELEPPGPFGLIFFSWGIYKAYNDNIYLKRSYDTPRTGDADVDGAKKKRNTEGKKKPPPGIEPLGYPIRAANGWSRKRKLFARLGNVRVGEPRIGLSKAITSPEPTIATGATYSVEATAARAFSMPARQSPSGAIWKTPSDYIMCNIYGRLMVDLA